MVDSGSTKNILCFGTHSMDEVVCVCTRTKLMLTRRGHRHRGVTYLPLGLLRQSTRDGGPLQCARVEFCYFSGDIFVALSDEATTDPASSMHEALTVKEKPNVLLTPAQQSGHLTVMKDMRSRCDVCAICVNVHLNFR